MCNEFKIPSQYVIRLGVIVPVETAAHAAADIFIGRYLLCTKSLVLPKFPDFLGGPVTAVRTQTRLQ